MVPVTLSYDQIPPGRRTIGDCPGRFGEHNGVLSVALAQWMARDDTGRGRTSGGPLSVT